jgi:hypothetical protein
MNIYMMNVDVHLSNKTRSYGMLESVENGKDASNPLTLEIEKIVGETMTHIPKGALKKDSHNPNAGDAQKYSIVVDMAQNPYAMSSLEVLQSFPS